MTRWPRAFRRWMRWWFDRYVEGTRMEPERWRAYKKAFRAGYRAGFRAARKEQKL